MPSPAPPRTLLIACGALAREVLALIRLNAWSHMQLACLPAHLHNTPQRIPEAVRAKIRAARRKYERVLVLYGDCGTGGGSTRFWRRRASTEFRGRIATPSTAASTPSSLRPRRSPPASI